MLSLSLPIPRRLLTLVADSTASLLLIVVVDSTTFCIANSMALVAIDTADSTALAPSWRLVTFRLSILLQGSLVEDMQSSARRSHLETLVETPFGHHGSLELFRNLSSRRSTIVETMEPFDLPPRLSTVEHRIICFRFWL